MAQVTWSPPPLAGWYDFDRNRDLIPVVSLSGGKDSTATALALREAGVEGLIFVFADTGWEAPETYEYLDRLEHLLGQEIERVCAADDMVAKSKKRAGFPARMQRWCTRELKIQPLKEFHEWVAAEHDSETISITGVRAGESAPRSHLSPWEDDETWDGYVWRPLLHWSVDDVLRMHHRHDVDINPLYHAGFDRVGCWPCIFSRKSEIKTLAQHAPERVEEIRLLEKEIERIRAEANRQKPGRYSLTKATFFQTKVPGQSMDIHDVVRWAKAPNKRLPMLQLLDDVPEGGCFRWGMCEPPREDDDGRD